MSVPLDNLYHWIEGLLTSPAIVYVFHPHGNKKISNLIPLRKYNTEQKQTLPAIILHDQEPLDWELYQNPEQYLERSRGLAQKWQGEFPSNAETGKIIQQYICNFNLQSIVLSECSKVYDQVILIHSEKNSQELEKYQRNGFICIHYWAHAVIAQDWFRFAKLDWRFNQVAKNPKKFLIYCRDWSHRREYRLKFLEMLVKTNLDQVSKTSVMHTNIENVHFSQHQFINPRFTLDQTELLNCIPVNTILSTASADYCPEDFANCFMSVVLETEFDSDRIHLTEKTLRPIACGHPFLLVAGPGSLAYLKSYGFKTFAPWIDESYDLETDSLKRLGKIIEVMQQIEKLGKIELETFLYQVRKIADYNKQHFFSDEFTASLEMELTNNLSYAIENVQRKLGKKYLEILKQLKDSRLNKAYRFEWHFRPNLTVRLRQLRQFCQFYRSSPGEDSVV
jgi:hypothetical protein